MANGSTTDMALEDELALATDAPRRPPWRVLVVDDEPQVHAVTRLVLRDVVFEDRGIELMSAHSGAEAKQILAAHDDIAMMLLDVVMETEHAGLDVVRYCREELGNSFIRIVLRTGQPGQAPQLQVTSDYDINDYKEKTELTMPKLTTAVRVALRGYRDMVMIERSRRGLERVIASSARVFSNQQPAEFASAVLDQLGYLAGMERGALYCRAGARAVDDPEHLVVSAGTGEFARYVQHEAAELPAPLVESLRAALVEKQHMFRDDHYVLHFVDSQHGESLLYVGEACNLSALDFKLVQLFCTNVSIAYENLHLHKELFDSQREMICLLASAAETRSRETANHVHRVGLLTGYLARLAGVDDKSADALQFAAPLHDIGKISVPDAILNKPGRHTPDESVTMQLHAPMGAQMLASSVRPLLRLAAEIASSHHENWDGSGYPLGLQGEAIPLSGRLAMVADVFDALGSARCYKAAWPEEEIRRYFVEQRAVKFDPRLVDLVLAHWDDIQRLRASLPD